MVLSIYRYHIKTELEFPITEFVCNLVFGLNVSLDNRGWFVVQINGGLTQSSARPRHGGNSPCLIEVAHITG